MRRYKEIDRFEAEMFYKIEMTHEKDGILAEFNWRRGRLFDQAVCFILYEKMQEVCTRKHTYKYVALSDDLQGKYPAIIVEL